MEYIFKFEITLEASIVAQVILSYNALLFSHFNNSFDYLHKQFCPRLLNLLQFTIIIESRSNFICLSLEVWRAHWAFLYIKCLNAIGAHLCNVIAVLNWTCLFLRYQEKTFPIEIHPGVHGNTLKVFVNGMFISRKDILVL